MVRLSLAAFLFAWSLMVLLPAPRMPLFYLALAATEFGHWLALPALVLVFAGSRRWWLGLTATVFAWLAVALFLSSAFRASQLGQTLPTDFARAFSSLGYSIPDDAPPPFAWSPLWASGSVARGPVETFTFAENEGRALKLDFYRGSTRPLAPCVIVIHGGGWDGGSRGEFPGLNHALVARGYAVAAIDYRLAPRSPWPAQRGDVLAALAHLRTHAAELGIDPLQFVLLGRSAGGQIAEAVACSGPPEPAIRGCIAFYAPADLHFAFKYATANDVLDSPKLLTNYLGGTPADVRTIYDDASAILHVTQDTVPTLLLHGRRDELVWVRQSERLAARLREVGAAHLFIELPWATHAFDFKIDTPGGQIATWAVTHFLDAVTHREPVRAR